MPVNILVEYKWKVIWIYDNVNAKFVLLEQRLAAYIVIVIQIRNKVVQSNGEFTTHILQISVFVEFNVKREAHEKPYRIKCLFSVLLHFQ